MLILTLICYDYHLSCLSPHTDMSVIMIQADPNILTTMKSAAHIHGPPYRMTYLNI